MNAPLSKTQTILATAHERGLQKALPFAGEVTPEEAHFLNTSAGIKIIDVRFAFEHEYIGRIPGSTLIPWKLAPGGEVNRDFVPELQRLFAPDETVLLLCRSGLRSHAAAAFATEAGFTQAFNIIGGFEGDLDAQQQRNRAGGWRHANLPWIQD